MRILSYSGESVLTTDRVGEAVVDYARALIAEHATDVVDIPVLFENEELTASLVLGPASQLIVIPARESDTPLGDELIVARLRAKIDALRPRAVLPVDSDSVNRAEELDFDFL
ncbi:MAG TPA: hypothetical protein VHZ98_13375 [Galbitalea sp.]|jgi:hypothetical protein|nr:hypothetical protein [Galbitalea sp.]